MPFLANNYIAWQDIWENSLQTFDTSSNCNSQEKGDMPGEVHIYPCFLPVFFFQNMLQTDGFKIDHTSHAKLRRQTPEMFWGYWIYWVRHQRWASFHREVGKWHCIDTPMCSWLSCRTRLTECPIFTGTENKVLFHFKWAIWSAYAEHMHKHIKIKHKHVRMHTHLILTS